MLLDQNINDVLTWPTYYSVGNVQLTHAGGQAPVERREVYLTLPSEALSPLQPYLFFKETIRPGSPPGLKTLRICFFCSITGRVSRHLPLHHFLQPSGDEGIRTPDLRRAKAALSQLSYIPDRTGFQVGLSGLEPETSPLSEARSNQLS